MLALIALMTSAVSYGVALKVKSEDALAPLMNTVAQPVLLLSGILLPLTFAPGWLQGVADWNPFSWAVDGTRALFAGDLGNDKVWQGLVITARARRRSASSGRPASSPAASADAADISPAVPCRWFGAPRLPPVAAFLGHAGSRGALLVVRRTPIAAWWWRSSVHPGEGQAVGDRQHHRRPPVRRRAPRR